MKKTLLASALLASISAYAAIPSDINARADLVQKRNETITANVGKLYQQYLGSSPMFNKVDTQIRNYTRTDSGATEQSVITLDWNSAFFGGDTPPVKEIVMNSTIDYSDAVAKADKLAIIKSEVDADAIAKALEIGKDTDDFKTLNEILKHLEITTTLLDDEKFEQLTRIKPVDAKPEEGIHITYEGLEYNISSTDADAAHGYGKTTLKSGKLEATNSQENNDGPQKIILMPFGGEGEYRSNGDAVFDLKPIEFHADDSIFKAKNLELKGKDLVWDSILGNYLGEITYKINDISYASSSQPEAVYVKSVTVNAETQKSGELYDGTFKLEVLPVKESFAALTGGLSEQLGVKSIVADAEFKNISEQLWADFSHIQGDIQRMGKAENDPAQKAEAEKALENRINSMLAEAGKHALKYEFDLAINAEPGNATLDSHVEFLKGSKMTYAEVTSATEADSPQAFIDLLNKNIRFEVNIVLPKALVDAVGAGVFLEGNPYMPLDGKNYKLNLKNSDKGITLNGEAFPPAEPAQAAAEAPKS